MSKLVTAGIIVLSIFLGFVIAQFVNPASNVYSFLAIWPFVTIGFVLFFSTVRRALRKPPHVR